MIWRCLDSLMVLTAFAAVYILPPLLVVRCLKPSADRISLFAVSAGLGLSSQALLGFFWSHFIHHSPLSEGVVYFLFWLLTCLAFHWRKSKVSTCEQQPTPNNYSLPLLALILLAAIALRSLDALNHASLGQSDAYTHLQFLRDVLKYGQLRNIVYPPGYPWVLALPVLTFNLDAYLVTRYVGPFFGTLLVATLYLLGRRQSEAAGLYAAVLAAVCPLFYPLIKTGMGAFANQMGLLLLPLALLLYLRKARFLFTLILLGLTVTVPIFVFSLALIIVLSMLLKDKTDEYDLTTQQPISSTTMLPKPRLWLNENLVLLIPFLLAFALASYHFLTLDQYHVTTTATLVTGIQTPPSQPSSATTQTQRLLAAIQTHPAGKLAVDLFTIKRWGLGNGIMNLATLSIAGIFAGILVAGIQSGSGTFKLLGGWGLLTTLQASTGLLEFSLYQRSGWILLEAIALAGGIILAELHKMERMRKFIRPFIVLVLSASVIIAFRLPPQHRCITSGAEHELATVLRELSAARWNRLHTPGPLAFERLTPSPLIAQAATGAHLVVITRRYAMFSGDQGNLAEVLPDPSARVFKIPVEMDTQLAPPCDQFVCLVDRFSGLPNMGILERISPKLTHSLASYQSMLYQPNEIILAFLKGLPPDVWRITHEDRGPNLSIYLVKRLRP